MSRRSGRSRSACQIHRSAMPGRRCIHRAAYVGCAKRSLGRSAREWRSTISARARAWGCRRIHTAMSSVWLRSVPCRGIIGGSRLSRVAGGRLRSGAFRAAAAIPTTAFSVRIKSRATLAGRTSFLLASRARKASRGSWGDGPRALGATALFGAGPNGSCPIIIASRIRRRSSSRQIVCLSPAQEAAIETKDPESFLVRAGFAPGPEGQAQGETLGQGAGKGG